MPCKPGVVALPYNYFLNEVHCIMEHLLGIVKLSYTCVRIHGFNCHHLMIEPVTLIRLPLTVIHTT